jgi:sugar transferase EpsL
MKRLLDSGIAIILLITISPLALLISVCILCIMGRPVLFRQKRPGLNGQPFILYKFRTLKEMRDKQGNYLPDADRITSMGKLLRRMSVDEIPQLVNVIKGEMSLVGPRPLLMEYLDRYTTEQARRHEVRPGITGWAQINGRNAISWEDKFELDVWYVKNQSFCLDMRIIFKTVMMVINGKGVSQEGSATAEPYLGVKE